METVRRRRHAAAGTRLPLLWQLRPAIRWPEAIAGIRRAYKTLYREKLTLEQARAALASQVEGCPEVAPMLEFLAASTRGIVR